MSYQQSQQKLLNAQPGRLGDSSSTEGVPLLGLNEQLAAEESNRSTSCLSTALQCCCCPLSFGITCLSSIITVKQQTEAVVFRWGRYERTIKEPGMHFSNVFGRSIQYVATKIQSRDLPSTGGGRYTMLDADGNPLIVSAVVVFQFVDSYKAALAVQYPEQFILTQGETVLRDVVSRYPYESQDGAADLRTESAEVNDVLTKRLQEKVFCAGVRIHSFQLKEISYAPVIAAAMLKRQQAAAIVSARQTVVAGAVDIATGAIAALQERGMNLDEQATAQLVGNLLTVICSESEVTPTLPLRT